MKEFLAREGADFKIRVRVSECSRPVGLRHLEFVNEQYKDGELKESSTYEFFMTDEEIKNLSEGLRV